MQLSFAAELSKRVLNSLTLLQAFPYSSISCRAKEKLSTGFQMQNFDFNKAKRLLESENTHIFAKLAILDFSGTLSSVFCYDFYRYVEIFVCPYQFIFLASYALIVRLCSFIDVIYGFH